MPSVNADIADGNALMLDGGLDLRRLTQPLRRQAPDTWEPVLPVESSDPSQRFQDAPQIPWKKPCQARPSQTDWVWQFLPQFQAGDPLSNNPPQRKLPPQKLQGGEVSPPAVFERDDVYLAGPSTAPTATRTPGRRPQTFSDSPLWPLPLSDGTFSVVFTVSADPPRFVRKVVRQPAGDFIHVPGMTFELGETITQQVDRPRSHGRVLPEWGSGEPLLVTQAEELDWNVQQPGPQLQRWRPKRPDPQAEGNGGYFVLLAPTLTLSWWTRDELPRWIRPRRQGGIDSPVQPDPGGDLAVSWAIPTETPKRLPRAPSWFQDSLSWMPGVSFIVLANPPVGNLPPVIGPFWITAGGIFQAGASAGLVLG